ncbi:hypothetical protein [Fictibacillus sp. NRS-1165]|uniref:hypothetical protein n=1 Tax=Fictibacillus sp. NRS-1165 TaxID=3144463 RepID=UPI003D1CFB50
MKLYETAWFMAMCAAEEKKGKKPKHRLIKTLIFFYLLYHVLNYLTTELLY